MRSSISADEIVASVKSEIDSLYQTGSINASLQQKFESPLLIYKALNDADREICLYEKIAGNVSIFVPKDQNTVFFDRQSEFLHKFIDQLQSELADSQPSYFAWMMDEQQFVDVVSVLSSDMDVYSDIPLKSETPSQRIKLGTYQQLRSDNDYTRAHIEPNRRKLTLSAPFSEDRWISFYAQLAPLSFNIMDYDLSDIEDSYHIMSPHYTKAWLLLKTLNHLLPNTILNQEGLIEGESNKRQEAASMRPGTGNVIIQGDEYETAYDRQFADFLDITEVWRL